MTGRCRGCGQLDPMPVLDLGFVPLANALLREEQLGMAEPRFPLVLALCAGCALLQLTETVDPERLFGEYLYLSSVSESLVQHAGELVERLVQERGLGTASHVVELASNDGYLLQHYLARGIPAYGVEPARNVAAAAVARGVPTLAAFFDAELGLTLAREHGPADVIHAHNVLAHVPDPGDFLAGIRRLLAPEGIAVVEAPYVQDLLRLTAFDTIYHEHMSYFSLTSVAGLAVRRGLVVTEVEHVATHGGSLRYTLARGGEPGPAVVALLAKEAELGLSTPAPYLAFGQRVEGLKRELRTLLGGLKARGCRLAAYGASAKGTMLLAATGLGPETLDYVIDRGPAKQGLYLPGAHLLVRPPEALTQDPPDYLLLLSWNLLDEVRAQQAAWVAAGGRFIVPVPTPHVVDRDG